MISDKSYEFLVALFEEYAQSSDGREEENETALNKAWDEIIRLRKPRTLCVEASGGLVQDVHGLPDGWDYSIADWDRMEDVSTDFTGTKEEIAQRLDAESTELEKELNTLIDTAKALNQ